MSLRPSANALILIFCSCTWLPLFAAKTPTAQTSLAKGLRLGDLYNWADAGPDFTEAQNEFTAAGDPSNALWAEIGKIRSTIDKRNLFLTSARLDRELETNPILKQNKPLRMFCLMVKGDIDQEVDSRAMRADWVQVQALASELGDAKVQNRALAQIGIAAFYSGDLRTASQNVGTALAVATKTQDIGAQIRYTTVLGMALAASKMFDQAMPYFENALLLAGKTPETGYPFFTNEPKLAALIGLKQIAAAQSLADEMLKESERTNRLAQEAPVLIWFARLALIRGDAGSAIVALKKSIAIAQAAGYRQVVAEGDTMMSEIYGQQRKFPVAEGYANDAAAVTQLTGDTWSVPERLHTLARLQVSQGHYLQADQTYNRADAFVDASLGDVGSVLEKTALVKASSEMYADHFSLVAAHLNSTAKAYAIVEQLRGRVTADLLMSGSMRSEEARKTERAISKLQLLLMSAKSTNQVQRIRAQIFTMEQARWVTPGVNVLKSHLRESVDIEQVQRSLSGSAVMLEYVLAEPHSYCLVISRESTRIVQLTGRGKIESLVGAYLNAVKKRQAAHQEAQDLFSTLLAVIPEATQKEDLVVIRDGQLNLVPFDAFERGDGHYVVETQTVAYAPSATSFYLMEKQDRKPRVLANMLLAVGGIPYKAAGLKPEENDLVARGAGYADLPNSREEVTTANSAFRTGNNRLLLGADATESVFKHADLAKYRIIHMAVHGVADGSNPDDAALILLPDKAAGEDGVLQATEVAMLDLNADLVVLSACDTAVGPVQGEEGVSNLSKAFLLAGARSVISTLWSVDDNSSLLLMKQLYGHLGANDSAAHALTAAKREMLQNFGKAAIPYFWAGFTFEGISNGAMATQRPLKGKNVTE